MNMKHKTILIIGAGREQVPAYLIAKKMGLKIISTDQDENAPGFKFADHCLRVSTRDDKKTLEVVKDFCLGHQIDGVMTIANDVPLTVSRISNYYSLPGLSINSTLLLSNKMLMKEKFNQNHVQSPPFKKVNTLEDIVDFSNDYGFPLVLKPVDGRGSRGVILLKDMKGARKFFSKIKSMSNQDYLIVEKYIEGQQLSVESIFLNKKYFPIAFADRNYDLKKVTEPYFFEDGGVMPSSVSADDKKKISELVKGASKSLGIDWGSVKADIVLSAKGPQIIELAGRLSGGYMSTFDIPNVYNVDLVGILIRLSLGLTIDENEVKKKPVRAICSRYIYSLKDGKIKEFEFPAAFNKNIHTSKFLNKGDKIWALNSGRTTTRAGVVRALASDISKAKELAQRVIRDTKFIVKK